MFWPEPWDPQAAVDNCNKQWGVDTKYYWPAQNYGGWQISSASNIFFANGGYDPWYTGGVLHKISPSLPFRLIPKMGHHVDLMFSDTADSAETKKCRKDQLESISVWIQQHYMSES